MHTRQKVFFSNCIIYTFDSTICQIKTKKKRTIFCPKALYDIILLPMMLTADSADHYVQINGYIASVKIAYT